MNIWKINLAKGLLRLYFVLWIVFALFLCIDYYKELLTHVGVKYWTVESYVERREKELNDGRCNKINFKNNNSFFSLEDMECETKKVSIPYEIARMKDKSSTIWNELKPIILYVPLILLLFLIGVWFVFKWIFQGFRK